MLWRTLLDLAGPPPVPVLGGGAVEEGIVETGTVYMYRGVDGELL